MRDLDYLKLLAKEYPTVKAASSEIINLMAIRGLPKGTEYFFSDLHGEYEAFIHLLRSASGIIREKISETFGYVISDEEEIALANLIYYPERNIRRIQKEGKFTEDWQRITIYRLVRICKEVSSKFTRSKVRKKMPPAFAYIIDELLHVDYNDDNKKVYYDEIIHSIIDIEMGDQFIMALCHTFPMVYMFQTNLLYYKSVFSKSIYIKTPKLRNFFHILSSKKLFGRIVSTRLRFPGTCSV